MKLKNLIKKTSPYIQKKKIKNTWSGLTDISRFYVYNLNEHFLISYATIMQVLNLFTKKKLKIAIIDTRIEYQEFINTKFKMFRLLFQDFNWYNGFLNQLSKYYFKSKKEYKNLEPMKYNELRNCLFIINDIEANLILIQSAFLLQIPVICFYNNKLLYSNLYRLNGGSSFKFFYIILWSICYIIAKKKI